MLLVEAELLSATASNFKMWDFWKDVTMKSYFRWNESRVGHKVNWQWCRKSPMLAPNWNNEMYLNFLYLEVQKNEIENIIRSLMCYTTCVWNLRHFGDRV